MKIGILSKTICPATVNVIEYFESKGEKIEVVIIEKNYRKKFSENEISYRKAHDLFNRRTKKYSLPRRVVRRVWDIMPPFLHMYIEKNIYYLPILNHFSVRKYCEKKSIKVFEVNRHSSNATVDILKKNNIKYLLMVSSHWLLKPPLTTCKELMIINAHSGWLPKHKGLDSIVWSIKEGDPLGITTHIIDNGIDSGPILRFFPLSRGKYDDLNTINRKIFALQPKAFHETVKGLESGEIIPQSQNGGYRPHIPVSFDELWEINKKLRMGEY